MEPESAAFEDFCAANVPFHSSHPTLAEARSALAHRRRAGHDTRKQLTEHDRQLLAALKTDASALPASLAELVSWMAEHGEKGEQEGYL